MIYAKIDTAIFDDPDFEGNLYAVSLYIAFVCYSKFHLTDGKILKKCLHIVAKCFKKFQINSALDVLTRNKLVTVVDGDYLITNWERWNLSKEQVNLEREKTASRVRDFRNKKHELNDECNANVTPLQACYNAVTPVLSTEYRVQSTENTEIRENTYGGFCNKTPPSTSDETNENPSTSRVKPSKYTNQELEELWKTQLDAYPSRGKADRCIAKGKLAYFKLLRDGEEPKTILRGTQGYTAAMKTLGNDGTSYVKQLPTFFHNRTWEEYLSGAIPTNGRPQPPHLTPLQMADGCSYVWSENTWKLYTPSNDFEVMK